jgi:hypothetical protein
MAQKKSAEPEFIRPGIVPGIAGSVAVFISMATYESDWYVTVLFVICILAAILTVFSVQAVNSAKWVFIPVFGAITIYWNPIFRLNEGWNSGGQSWLLIEVAAAAAFFLGGFLLKTPVPER